MPRGTPSIYRTDYLNTWSSPYGASPYGPPHFDVSTPVGYMHDSSAINVGQSPPSGALSMSSCALIDGNRFGFTGSGALPGTSGLGYRTHPSSKDFGVHGVYMDPYGQVPQ